MLDSSPVDLQTSVFNSLLASEASLHAALEAIRDRRHSVTSPPSPSSTLSPRPLKLHIYPDELLCEIFAARIANRGASLQISVLINLIAVCQSWRYAAFSEPSFWNIVDFPSLCADDPFPVVSLYLQNGRTVKIITPPRDPLVLVAYVLAAVTNMGRHISVSDIRVNLYQSIHAPSMCTLTVDGSMAFLKAVAYPFWFDGLTTLYLDNIAHHFPHSVILSCPVLQDIRLGFSLNLLPPLLADEALACPSLTTLVKLSIKTPSIPTFTSLLLYFKSIKSFIHFTVTITGVVLDDLSTLGQQRLGNFFLRNRLLDTFNNDGLRLPSNDELFWLIFRQLKQLRVLLLKNVPLVAFFQIMQRGERRLLPSLKELFLIRIDAPPAAEVYTALRARLLPPDGSWLLEPGVARVEHLSNAYRS